MSLAAGRRRGFPPGDQVRRDFLQEAAGAGNCGVAKGAPGHRQRDVEFLPRPRDSHVKKAPFFLETTWLQRAHPVGQEVFFKARQEHNIEFQPLRGVKGHQRDGARGVIKIISGCHQGHLGQEIDQCSIGVIASKFPGDGDKFLDVLGPGIVLGVNAGLQNGQISGGLQNLLNGLNR